MALYKISFTNKAHKQLIKLPREIGDLIFDRIISLSENPRPFGYEKLIARPGYRIRIGDYRVVYNIGNDSLIILILQIGHRKDIYQ